MNVTHQLYKDLCANQPLLVKLEQAVACKYPEEGKKRLQKLLAHHGIVEEQIDYTRLVSFIRKDFRGCDLQGEDFSSMVLEGFDFTEANLSEADLSGAKLNHAKLSSANLSKANGYRVQMREADLSRSILRSADFSHADLSYANLDDAQLTSACFNDAVLAYATCKRVQAAHAAFVGAFLKSSVWNESILNGASLNLVIGSQASFIEAQLEHATIIRAELDHASLDYAKCGWSNWQGTTLQGASLRNADLAFCHMAHVNFEDAVLRNCDCFTTLFGKELRYNSRTQIDTNSHPLISAVLLTCAKTPRQKQFALYIRHEINMCWPGFTRYLSNQPTDMADWVKEALGAIESLRHCVEEQERHYQELRSDECRTVDLADVDPWLHALIREEISKHSSLKNRELYWVLRGVLSLASRLPGVTLTEAQYAEVVNRLRAMTHQ